MRTGLRTLTPLLVVSNLERSLDFYVRRLGFGSPSVHGDPPCFAILSRDGHDVFLSVAEDPSQVAPHGRFGVWDLSLCVEDLEAEMTSLQAAGVPLVSGPRDTFYGMREIEVSDPDGHRVCIAQDLGDPTPVVERWEATLDLGARRLRLVLAVTETAGCLRAVLDSPDQGAFALPVDRIARDATTLQFEMIAIGASFTGTRASAEDGTGGERFEGAWSQGGGRWPLAWTRA